MSRVTIIGGHGKIALLLAPLLVELGHDVTSWVRNDAHLAEVAATGATARVVDVEASDEHRLAEALAGQEVVVWSAGAGGGDPKRTVAVDRDAAIRSMSAAAAAGADRYVMVSYYGAGPDHGVPEGSSFHAYAEAKSAADAALESGALGWTVLRPSTLRDDAPTGRIEVAPAGGATSVTRGDVAAVVAAVVEDDATVHRVIEFNNGSVPIAEALAATT